MHILFCDNHILVAVKPVGLSTQEDFTPPVKAWVKHKFLKPGAVFIEPIHRLDKAASGIVLFARTSKALSRLQQQMRERAIRKKYLALVEGEPDKPEGLLKNWLIHGDHKASVVPEGKEGKLAELEYRVVKKQHPLGGTLIEVELFTGRYHQIRAQMAHLGHPLRGDIKYGGKPWKGQGIALHHTWMQICHPVSQTLMSWQSLPDWHCL